MPPNAKPTVGDAEWASNTGTAVIATILAGQKALGWVKGQRPPEGILNRLFTEAWKWHKYVDTFVDNALTWSAAQVYSAAVTLNGALTTNAATTFNGGPLQVNVATAPTADIAVMKSCYEDGPPKRYARLLVSFTTYGWSLTLNADYDSGGGVWVADDSGGAAWRLVFGSDTKALALQYHGAAASWVEAAWVNAFDIDVTTLGVSFAGEFLTALVGPYLKATTARTSATLGAGQAVAMGEVWKETPPVAQGRVITITNAGLNTATASSVRSYGIASIALQGGVADGPWRITLQTAVPNGLLDVRCFVTAASAPTFTTWNPISTTAVDIYFWDAPSGGAVAPPATGFSFTINGY